MTTLWRIPRVVCWFGWLGYLRIAKEYLVLRVQYLGSIHQPLLFLTYPVWQIQFGKANMQISFRGTIPSWFANTLFSQVWSHPRASNFSKDLFSHTTKNQKPIFRDTSLGSFSFTYFFEHTSFRLDSIYLSFL